MSTYTWPPEGGGGVTSLNTETGDVTLVAGPGITITPVGQNITITNTEAAAPVVIGALDSQPENANGLAIVTNVLSTQSADATHPGMVNNTTQSFSGNKTFTGTISASNLSGTNTGDVTLAAFGSTPNANGLSLAGQVLNLQPADATHSGGLSSTDWNTFNNKQSTLTTGNLTDVGTDGIIIGGGTGAVIGTGTSITQHVADTTHNGYLSSVDWNTFNGKQASGNYITALTGDITASGPGSVAATLATVNANVGSFGSSTAIPNFTVNAKGLVTAAGTNVVIAPAGTLSGTTLNSTVVTSSLTSVGTIATGVWNGTSVDVAHGGTGLATLTANNVILGNGASSPTFVAPSTSGNVLTSNGTTWTSAPAPTGSNIQVAYIRDEKASTFTGGTFTSGTWQTRTLNTSTDPSSIVTLASNQFTLASGTYIIDATAPAYSVDKHQARLQDITNSATIFYGGSELAQQTVANETTQSRVCGVLVVTGTTTYEIQHQCQSTQGSTGFGIDAGFSGNTEVYTQVMITKIA